MRCMLLSMRTRVRRVTGASWPRHHEETRSRVPKRPVEIATAYAHAGDRDQAFAWPEQAVEERDAWVIYSKVYPAFATLRSILGSNGL